jgi:uncharacterized integral membrane protein
MTLLLKTVWQFLLIASRVFVFIALFVIAALNTQVVNFFWFPGLSLETPLILLLLCAFLLGIGMTSIAALIRRRKKAV